MIYFLIYVSFSFFKLLVNLVYIRPQFGPSKFFPELLGGSLVPSSPGSSLLQVCDARRNKNPLEKHARILTGDSSDYHSRK
jgi:hypothetical protein